MNDNDPIYDGVESRNPSIPREPVAWVRIKNDQYEVHVGGSCPHNRGSGFHGPWIQAGKLSYAQPAALLPTDQRAGE